MMNPNAPAGLPNIGNSCHMNSAIQAICSTRTLAGIFSGTHSGEASVNYREIVNLIIQDVMRNGIPEDYFWMHC